MAVQVLTDVRTYLGAYDVSGDLTATALTYGSELQDDTTFGDTTRSRTGGLKTVSLTNEGLWSGGTGLVDAVLWSDIGVADVPVTVVPGGETLANPCYLFRAIHGEYSPGATIGELLRFSVTAEGSGGVGAVRGELLHVGSETVTGVETGAVLGLLGAGQTMYAALHVLTVSGTNPTLDVIIQSDEAGFGSPTSRITFAQATGITSEWASLAGAIATDTYWRASWTIGGTDTPTFEFIVSVGII